MIKELSFNGLTAVPSDHECPDGDLAVSYNVINENGALQPIKAPEAITGGHILPNKQSVVASAHKLTHGNVIHTHLIIHDKANAKWYWAESGTDNATLTPFSFGSDAGLDFNSVCSIGNILCFVADNKTVYALWKDSDYTTFSQDDFAYDITLSCGASPKDIWQIRSTFDEDTFKSFFSRGTVNNKVGYTSITASGARIAFNALDAELNKRMENLDNKYMGMKTKCTMRV